MRFTIQHPIGDHGYAPELLDPTHVASFARAAEAAGFDALAFTEHPVPSQKWLDAGGHDSFDVVAALSFCAAVTEHIRLIPYALILPYRNPFLTAKAAATLDLLSRGRLVLAVGTGYLRSEFAALGVEFEERNALFDEAVEAMLGIWTTGGGLTMNGRHFRSLAQSSRPRPFQRPHPPLWIAGNSRMARERAVRYGQGWCPLQIGPDKARTTRTPPLTTVDDVRGAVTELRHRLERAGRDPGAFEVQIESAEGHRLMHGDLDGHVDRVAELADAGVTQFVVHGPNGSAAEAEEALARYGSDVIDSLR